MEQPRRYLSDRLRDEDLPLAAPSHAPKADATPLADGYTVQADLPPAVPVTRDEVAVLRAFLGTEIDAILFGHGTEQDQR